MVGQKGSTSHGSTSLRSPVGPPSDPRFRSNVRWPTQVPRSKTWNQSPRPVSDSETCYSCFFASLGVVDWVTQIIHRSPHSNTQDFMILRVLRKGFQTINKGLPCLQNLKNIINMPGPIITIGKTNRGHKRGFYMHTHMNQQGKQVLNPRGLVDWVSQQ